MKSHEKKTMKNFTTHLKGLTYEVVEQDGASVTICNYSSPYSKLQFRRQV